MKTCRAVWTGGEELPVGETHVRVTVRNPAMPDKSWEGRFLVDTGATDSFVPRTHLEDIGIKPLDSYTYELADGSEVEYEVGMAQIELLGRSLGGSVAFGEPDSEPLLGLTALETVGLIVDPIDRQLKPRSKLRL